MQPGWEMALRPGMFYVLAILTLVSAVLVVTRKNPIHSALWLIVTFVCLAGIYLLLKAEFVAVVQLLIYAGGIMILYLFAIMLVALRREEYIQPIYHGQRGVAMLLGLALFVLLFALLWTLGNDMAQARPGEPLGVPAEVGMQMFTDFLLPFELISILLLVAILGAVVLAKRRLLGGKEDFLEKGD